jgi:hypothetical protein
MGKAMNNFALSDKRHGIAAAEEEEEEEGEDDG